MFNMSVVSSGMKVHVHKEYTDQSRNQTVSLLNSVFLVSSFHRSSKRLGMNPQECGGPHAVTPSLVLCYGKKERKEKRKINRQGMVRPPPKTGLSAVE